jgi:hypothetical protein
MEQKNPLAVGMSLLFLCLLLACLGTRFWVEDTSWKKTGPTHIAASPEQVFLFAAGELLVFSADGQLQQRLTADVTGLHDQPIDLQVTRDGRLLVSEQRPARIRRCQTDPWNCEDIGDEIGNHLSRQFKVKLNTPVGYLVASDASGDTIWGINEAGLQPRQLVPAGTLAGPNGFAFDLDGRLWVADTDHRRIVELVVAENGELEPGREHSALNQLTIEERYYPMMLAQAPDGLWWVIQAAEFSEGTADLVLYDPDTGVNNRIELPADGYPTDIANLGLDMLVSDLETFSVYQINTRTFEVGGFGDASFAALMSELKERKAYYKRLSALALVGVIVFGILMVVMALQATPRDKRWTPLVRAIDFEKMGQTSPPSAGIHWLERNSRVDRALKWAAFSIPIYLGGLLIALLVALGWALGQDGTEPGSEMQEMIWQLGLLTLVFALFIGGLLFMLRLAVKPMKHRLGSDGKKLLIRLDEGRELSVQPADLFYTHRSILYQQYTIPLQNGRNQNLYVDGEVENWLFPLLEKATKLSPMQAIKHQWKHRDALLLWSVVSGVVLGLVLILLNLTQA